MKRVKAALTYLDDNGGWLSLAIFLLIPLGYGAFLILLSADWMLRYGVPDLEPTTSNRAAPRFYWCLT